MQIIVLANKRFTITGFPEWAYYFVGTIFLVVAIFSFYSFKWTCRKIKIYRELQLKNFRSANLKNKHLTYKEAGLRLPIIKVVYQYLPIFSGIVFSFLAITFITRLWSDNPFA